MKRMIFTCVVVTVALMMAGCSRIAAPTTNAHDVTAKGQSYAIRNVNVITMMQGSEVLMNRTVIINKNTISAIDGPVPPHAKIIDGTGKWLMPGLMDMHVHIPTDIHFGVPFPTQAASVFFYTQDVMIPYVTNGVTTVLELSAKAEHFGQRNEIAKGETVGPRMALAALINGGSGSGRIVNTAQDGRQAARSAKAEGYEFIKLYSQLSVETFEAIVDEANKQGLKTIGHIPNAFRGKVESAFVPHFNMIAHAEELSKHSTDFSEEDAKRFAQMMKANGTWLTPTLTTIERILEQVRSLDQLRVSPLLQYVHPLLQSKWLTANNYNRNSSPEVIARLERMIRFHTLLVRACKEAGVPMVLGTDTGASGLFAGFAVHDELQLLVAAGLTNEEALKSATVLPASWLGIDSLVGTVEKGKRADLVLLNANPLNDIKNSKNIDGVFVDGKWLDKATINNMLSGLAQRNNANKNQFDWKKTIGR